MRINLGALYGAEAGDTLQDLAARFQAAVLLLLSLSPDVGLAAAGSTLSSRAGAVCYPVFRGG